MKLNECTVVNGKAERLPRGTRRAAEEVRRVEIPFMGGGRGGGISFKTLRRGRGGVRLEAANPAYKPIRFKGEMELRVFGVVTAVIHRLRTEGEQAGG